MKIVKALLAKQQWPRIFVIILLFSSCRTNAQPSTTDLLDQQQILTVAGWAGYIPDSVLKRFEQEYGIAITYYVYQDQEEALADLRAGKTYDVVTMGSQLIPTLLSEKLLAPLNYQNIPNFKYISPNFRDLAYDPGNRYSIMFQWGIMALLVRSDLAEKPAQSWNVLWDKTYQKKIGIWPYQRDIIAFALKSLGYSANSQNPSELQAARTQVLKLKETIQFVDSQQTTVVPQLASGEFVMANGWSFDILEGRTQKESFEYFLPQEGTILWGDNLIIPMNSANKKNAEIFINYLLQPEICAAITNEVYIATPNEAANKFIRPEILNDTAVFPTNEMLQKAELLLALPPEVQQQYDQIWQEFLALME